MPAAEGLESLLHPYPGVYDGCMRQPRKRIGSGPEARIRAEYQKHRHCWHTYDAGTNSLFMHLCRAWQRPMRTIKYICRPDKYPRPADYVAPEGVRRL